MCVCVCVCVTECIVCVSAGYDPFDLSFLSFSFLIVWEFCGPNCLVLKLVRWASSVPFPSLSAAAGHSCLFAVAAGVHYDAQGRTYTVSWLVQIKVML